MSLLAAPERAAGCTTCLGLGGVELHLDAAGVLFWPQARLLAVADLHLEKGSACARGGRLVPPYDSRVTLERLGALLARLRPEIVVAVGDSFHDLGAPSRLGAEDAGRLAAVSQAARFVWVRGNHDRLPCGIAGDSAEEFRLGPLVFRHQSRGEALEISGHYHPKARIPTRAGQVARPCFVADKYRIMLPAFGAYTGGMDVRSPQIAGLFPRDGHAFLLGERRLFSFALNSLR